MNREEYYKLQEELEREAYIQPGDIFIAQGIRAEIKEVYDVFRFVEWNNEREKYEKVYDVVFRDTNGICRHWKSNFDGGRIEYKPRSESKRTGEVSIEEHLCRTISIPIPDKMPNGNALEYGMKKAKEMIENKEIILTADDFNGIRLCMCECEGAYTEWKDI